MSEPSGVRCPAEDFRRKNLEPTSGTKNRKVVASAAEMALAIDCGNIRGGGGVLCPVCGGGYMDIYIIVKVQ